MPKKIHTSSKIFFPVGAVVRVTYPDDASSSSAFIDYGKECRRVIKTASATWGSTILDRETYGYETGPDVTMFPIFNKANAVHTGAAYKLALTRLAGYLCFQSSEDALSFMLSAKSQVTRVKIWPSRLLFTIHEFEEE